MKKEAILKMVDTFIRDLKEIRKDVEKFEVSEDAESYVQYTDDELAAFIAKILEDRENKLNILDKAAELSDTPKIERTQEVVKVVTIDDIIRILEKGRYEYSIRPDEYNAKNKAVVLKDMYTNAEMVAFIFLDGKYLSSIVFNGKLYIKNFNKGN